MAHLSRFVPMIRHHLPATVLVAAFEKKRGDWLPTTLWSSEPLEESDQLVALVEPATLDYLCGASFPTLLPRGIEGSEWCLLGARATAFFPLRGKAVVLYVVSSAAEAFDLPAVEAAYATIHQRRLPYDTGVDSMTSLTAGFARQSITPPVGTPMAGFAARREGARGVHDDLYAHVAAIGCGTALALLVNLDIIGITDSLRTGIRNSLQAECDVPPEHIMICATHTHSGPVAGNEVEATVVEAVSKAASEALEDKRPVTVRIGSDRAPGIAFDRRSMQESPDEEVLVAGFYTADGQLSGCIVNFPLHATILGAENLLISADYPGYLRESITRRHPRCVTLFINGAAGNINIGYSADASALGEIFDFRTFAKAEEVGTCIGDAVTRALAVARPTSESSLSGRELDIPLPTKQLPSLDTLTAEIETKTKELERLRRNDAPPATLRETEIQRVYLRALKRNMERHSATEKTSRAAIRIHILDIGNLTLVGIPGELFVEPGMRIKQASDDRFVMIAGYTNGSIGYLPTPAAYDEGGYEVEVSIFGRRHTDTLVEAIAAALASPTP